MMMSRPPIGNYRTVTSTYLQSFKIPLTTDLAAPVLITSQHSTFCNFEDLTPTHRANYRTETTTYLTWRRRSRGVPVCEVLAVNSPCACPGAVVGPGGCSHPRADRGGLETALGGTTDSSLPRIACPPQSPVTLPRLHLHLTFTHQIESD